MSCKQGYWDSTQDQRAGNLSDPRIRVPCNSATWKAFLVILTRYLVGIVSAMLTLFLQTSALLHGSPAVRLLPARAVRPARMIAAEPLVQLSDDERLAALPGL